MVTNKEAEKQLDENLIRAIQTISSLYADEVNKIFFSDPVSVIRGKRSDLGSLIISIRYKIAKVLLSLANKVSWRAYDDEFYQY